MNCERARTLLHERHDGDAVRTFEVKSLETHLDGCAGCRGVEAELRMLQQAFTEAPQPPLPDDVLAAVFAETSRRRSPWAWLHAFNPKGWQLEWRVVAAAAGLALALGVWGAWPERHGGYTEQELQQAALEARLVLKLTHRALDRTQQTALDDVLSGQVSPALQRVPIRLRSKSAQTDG